MRLFPNGLYGRMPTLAPASGADALVKRTLARHGLTAPLLNGKIGTLSREASLPTANMPDGARFDSGSFTCGANQREYWL